MIEQVQQAQQAAFTSTAMAQEAKALYSVIGNSSMQLEQVTKAEEATQAMSTKAEAHVAALPDTEHHKNCPVLARMAVAPTIRKAQQLVDMNLE